MARWYLLECRKQLVHWDQGWIINCRSTFGLSLLSFNCQIMILGEIRSRDSIVSFSGGKSNTTPRNSHPPYWDGAMLLLFNVQGSVRETQVDWCQQRREQEEQQLPYVPDARPVLPRLGRGPSSAWVHRDKQGLMKQELPCFNTGLWWHCLNWDLPTKVTF